MRKILATAIPLTVAFMLGHTAPAVAQNPFNTTDGNPDAGVAAITDPAGNAKELGPKNGDPTKIGAINTALVPMLEFTNPNAQVDLNTVYIATRKDLTSSDSWLYFAWRRDSESGSGFISIEFQQNALPNGCVYAGVDFSNKNDPETQALIASCNPWVGRKSGDFVIMWDQQGNDFDPDLDIKKRVFTCTPAGVCTLGGVQDLDSVEAAISADRFSGEMAINLTDDVFDPNAGCQTFANVIPGTVTGNSDTADYKDTVFSAVPPITNCGVLTVKKVTVDAGGNPLPDTTTVFSYKVDRADASALRFAADAADHPLDGPAGFAQLQILRPNAATSAPGIKDGETQTHTDLIAGTNYRLVELGMPTATYQLKSIICADGSVGSPKNITAGGTFQIVIATGTEKTECVITNEFIATAPGLTTTQNYTVSLSDSVSITGLQAQPAANRAANVIFRLYSAAGCGAGTELTSAAGISAAITYNGTGTEGSASSGNFPVTVTAGVATTFYWRVFYPGDGTKNLAASTPCGLETTTVTISKNDSGSLP